MTLLGYARVSTLHQSPAMQTKALTEAGAERIWTDRMSGARDDRPELAALLDYARRGDVLMVWRLDRLGRSLPHLLTIADDLQDRGIELRSLTEAIDTTTPGGRLIFPTSSALSPNSSEPSPPNAPPPESPRPAPPAATQAAQASWLAPSPPPKPSTRPAPPRAQIARTLGISRSSVYRSLDAATADATLSDHRELTPRLNISIPEAFDAPLPEAELAEWEKKDL